MPRYRIIEAPSVLGLWPSGNRDALRVLLELELGAGLGIAKTLRLDPLPTFGKLARHLLMLPTEAQLAETIELSSFDRPQKQEAEEDFKERPKASKQFFREGKTRQWKTELTQKQIQRIIATRHVQMRRFGYLPDGA